MIRRWIAMSVVCSFVLAGCSDSPRPVRREMPAETAPAPASGGMAANPHGLASSGSEPADLADPVVDLGSMQLTAPAGWVRKQPKSGFTLAEFSLPGGGDESGPGRLTVTSVGGSIDANVSRWRQQFGGKPEKESSEKIEVAGVKITVIDLLGTFDSRHMGMGPSDTKEGMRMRSAIFDVDGAQHVIKSSGPALTMEAEVERMDAFLQSLEPVKSAE